MSLEPMRVELNEFCQDFSAALNPFAEKLDRSTQALRKTADAEGIQTVLNELLDNQHRLKILRDKAHEQHTYLVIFGPLKSGKSTLMNAVSGSYVSEVSSLPAYPCLVYVHEGEERGFATTCFNGDETHYDSREQLHDTLEKAHEELARRIRQADETEQSFNPAQDFGEAIRRIDFTMPAPYLKESGTILVDTPGLYTKMKYNYGQLTRDFRNTAACAVFVVKTDNLFFEQVFEEFADLLEVFSRVFLVVNIDSSKQDLGPDGKLEPSLEQENPRKIIEAFENLTVSAQIREAIENERLRIYMVDLLHTAERSLQREAPEPAKSAETGEDPVEAEGDADSDSAAAKATSADADEGPQVGFEAFLGDLTEYLNSNEYIVEFMADSLRQANSILHEVKDQIASPVTAEFREAIEGLEKRTQRAERQLGEVNSLRDNKWDGPLEELSREIKQQVTEHTGSVLPDLKDWLHSEVNSWIDSDESVRDLVENRILPRVRQACTESRSRAIQLVDGACASRNSGLRLSAEIVGRMHGLDLSFDDIYPKFQPKVSERFQPEPKLPDAGTIQEQLPVRHRFFDWLLFRSPGRVRQRVLGEKVPSDKPIPAQVKLRRIGDDGKARLHEAVDRYTETAFAATLEDELDGLFADYRAFFRQNSADRLDAKVAELQKERDTSRESWELRKDVVQSLDQLDAASNELRGEVHRLHDRFVAGKPSIGTGLEVLDLPTGNEEEGEALPDDQAEPANPQSES